MIALMVWQIGGLWRSASRRGGFWAGAAKILVIIGIIQTVSGTATEVTKAIPRQAPTTPGLAYSSVPFWNSYLLKIAGEIHSGDYDRFLAYAGTLPEDVRNKVIGISLDSLGGGVEEKIKFARLIHQRQLGTIIEADAHCVSACFVIFAGGVERVVSQRSVIGVHSIRNYDDSEDQNAQSWTVQTARVLKNEFGVSDQIIAKLIETPPANMYKLTSDDLTSMRVEVFDAPHLVPGISSQR